MLKKRTLGSLVAGVAVCFALAGCSLLPSALSPAAPGSTSATPKVGQCWSATDSQADAWADWRGSSPVDCTASHVLYTFELGKISGVAAKSWAVSSSSTALSDEVQAKAEAACTTKKLLPDLKWNEQLVQEFFFVPSEAQWKAGARWVRCDVGVLGYGAPLSDEVLAPLPAKISTLVSIVSSDPARYDFCVNSPVPVSESGPLDNQAARIADCRANPQWALVGHGNLTAPAGAAYPSESVANAESATICSKYAATSNELWIAYLPSKSDWRLGNARDVECWVGQKSDDGSGSGGIA